MPRHNAMEPVPIKKGGDIKGSAQQNDHHDFAVEVSDGEEQKSEEEEEEEDDGTKDLTKTQNQKYQQWKDVQG